MADEVRRGSKQFSPGTKVHCLPSQWGDGYDKCVENPRAKVVYDPQVVKRLRDGFQGFNRQWESREEIEHYVQAWRQAGRSMPHVDRADADPAAE